MTYSQFGEDRMIEEVFDRIGTQNKWCFEVGAADGRWLSNTLLFRERFWSAILGEKDPKWREQLMSNCASETQSFPICEEIVSLDEILDRCGAPHDIDLGVIDVDGDDFWLWKDMEQFSPRVVLIEHNPYVNQADYDPTYPVPRGQGQTSKAPLISLGLDKGYRQIGETFCNLLFVKGDI